MEFIKKHKITFVIFLGLLIRLSLLFLDYSWDVNSFIAWGKDLNQRGFPGFYETISSEVYAPKYPNYPPFSLFMFYLIYPLKKIIFDFVWFLNTTIPAFPSNLVLFVEKRSFIAGLFKLPGIFADLAIGILMLKFSQKLVPNNKKIALLALMLILLNPAVFYISAYWGQIDSIPLLLTLSSVYLLMFSKRHIWSFLLFVSAVLFKPTVLLFFPIYLVYFIWKFGLYKFIKTFCLSNILFWLTFLPFFKKGNILTFPYTTYYKSILLGQDLTFTTNSAFNFWAVVTGFNNIQDSAKFIFNFSYQQIGLLITFGFLLFITIVLLKKEFNLKYFIYALTLSVFSSFLFLTKMHERYSILILPFILLLGVIEKKNLKIFIILSIISFFNLYHSWPVPRNETLLALLSNNIVVVLISTLNVFLFGLLFLEFIKLKKEGELKKK